MLHERLLRDLTAQQLSGFAGEALTVWGGCGRFQAFPPPHHGNYGLHSFDCRTPRAFSDPLPTGGGGSGRPTNSGLSSSSSMHSGGMDSPLPSERRHRRDAYGDRCTDVDLTPFLAWWIEQPGEEPLRHLAELTEVHGPILLAKGRMANAFWGVAQRRATDVVVSWIASGRPRERLVDGFFTASSAAIEEDLSNAVRVLNRWRLCPTPGNSRERRVTGRDRREYCVEKPVPSVSRRPKSSPSQPRMAVETQRLPLTTVVCLWSVGLRRPDHGKPGNAVTCTFTGREGGT